MKSFLLALSAVCISGSSALAWVGGPFSNDTADNNGADGIHSAVLRGPNLTGVLQMPIGAAATGVGGVASVVLEGVIAAGEVLGTADVPGRTMAGVMSTRTSSTFSVYPNDILEDATSISLDNITPSVLEIPGSSAPGSFEAKITQTSPAFTWEGSGTIQNFASVTGIDPETGLEVTPEVVRFTISGIRTSLTLPEINVDPFQSFLTTSAE